MSLRMEILGERECYGRIEIAFDEDANITHVRVITPSGKEETLLPFYRQFAAFTYDGEGLEHTAATGEGRLACRYTPEECGRFVLEAWRGQDRLAACEVDIARGRAHGYVEVSKKDRRYFAYTDGTPFFWRGINLCYPTPYEVSNGSEFGKSDGTATMGLRQYSRWLRRCAENGVNVVRLWLGHTYFTPDTEQLYQLDLLQWEKLDRIVSLAREYGIRLKLTLDHFRHFGEAAAPNIFYKAYSDGEVACQSAEEWLRDGRWADGWLYKVSELAKRYAGDPTVCMIELWNEMNGVRTSKREYLTAWNRSMLPRVKALFPRQLVTNSLSSLDGDWAQDYYRSFCWDIFDVLQVHRYLDQGAGFKICGGAVIPSICEAMAFVRSEEKPFLLAETGAVNNRHSGEFKYYSCDDRGIIFVDCVYTPVFLNSAGCGNIWHWDRRYVESKNLYKYFAPLASLTEGVDFPEEQFRAVDLSTDDAYVLLLCGRTVSLGFVRNKADSWFSTLRDGHPVGAIERVTLPLAATAARLYPIWEEDTASLHIEDGHPVLENVRYGALFRLF